MASKRPTADGIPVMCAYDEIADVDSLVENPRNPNKHPDKQIELLAKIIKNQGWRAPIVVSKRSGFIVKGHARLAAARKLGVSQVPVDVQDYENEAIEWADMIADNRIAELAEVDTTVLKDVLEELDTGALDMDLTGYDEVELERLMTSIMMEADALEAMAEHDLTDADKVSARNLPVDGLIQVPPRDTPLDTIYTLKPNNVTFWLAVSAGLKVGVRSSRDILRDLERWYEKLPIVFVDNEYKDYDHALHLECVAAMRPKYCTVRDYMTKAQCRDAGIRYYDLDTILGWADELARYAENVIIIPKYDVIKDIPERFMLGYSVPTSYGGTSIPTRKFKGRRVHLLGGSWRDQRIYLNLLGEDVVSLDFNQAYLLAKYGVVVMPEGYALPLDKLGIDTPLGNPGTVAFALSVGHITKEVYRITQGLSGQETDLDERAAIPEELAAEIPSEEADARPPSDERKEES